MAEKPPKKKLAKKKPVSKGHTKPRRLTGDHDAPDNAPSGSELVDARISELGDWRGETLSRLRTIIKKSVREVVEETKWRKPSNSMKGVPVWSSQGIICTGETYKDKVKLTFAKGAALDDPSGLFNASLGGSTRRAIDLHEGDAIDEIAFAALVCEAAELNQS